MPSLLMFGMLLGRAKRRTTTKRPKVAELGSESMSNTPSWLPQVSSHWAHKRPVSQSKVKSMTPAWPLAKLAMRWKSPRAWSSAYA